MAEIYNKDKASKVANIQKPLLSTKERKAKIDSAIIKSTKNAHAQKTKNPFAAFSYYPHRVAFVSKDPQEEVILMLRKHPITNLKWIITAILMLFFPFAFPIFPFFTQLPEAYQLVLTLIWYLIVVAYILESFLTWFFNVNIITDERVIDVDFHNLIFREITDANLDQIQDVTVQIGGGARTFLNYGSVLIQTAAEIPLVEFVDVPKPDQVSSVLRELRVEEELEKIEGRVR